MANAKRCDRCGKFYEYIEDEKKTLFIFKYNSSDIRGWPDERLDLCNDCYKNLEKFINIKDHEEKVRDKERSCYTCLHLHADGGRYTCMYKPYLSGGPCWMYERK